MKYERSDWDWGYIAKVGGTCLAALGLATILALSGSNKPIEPPKQAPVVKKKQVPLEDRVQQLPVGSAKLASEVSDVTQYNTIVVGGPSSNPIAADLLGYPEPPVRVLSAPRDLEEWAQEQYNKGNYKKNIDLGKGSITGDMYKDGERWTFTMKDGKLYRLFNKDRTYEIPQK